MYVTKRNVENVVASVTKQLDQVSTALAATKRHLTQRLENVDGKLDEQKEISKVIKDEVFEVRGDLSQIGFDIEAIQKMVSGLEGKIVTLEDKQVKFKISSQNVFFIVMKLAVISHAAPVLCSCQHTVWKQCFAFKKDRESTLHMILQMQVYGIYANLWEERKMDPWQDF
eukprot:Gb_30348 [translate_table: standard]